MHLCVLRDSHYNTMYFYKQLTSVFISIEKTLFFEKYAINLNMLGYRLETYKNLSSFDHHIPKLTMRNHSTLRNKIVKWSRYRPCMAQRVGRGITLLFHDRGTRRGWVVSSTPRPHFTPRERSGTHFTGGWVGPRAGLDGRKVSSPPGFDPGPSSP